MKKLLYFLPLAIVLLAQSCAKPEEEYPVGGYSFDRIYILSSNALVKAHNTTITVPAKSSTIELEIVSYGLGESEMLSGDDSISIVEDSFTFPPEETELYDVKMGTKRYKQKIHFHTYDNTTTKTKSATFRIISHKFNGFAADITIVQDQDME